MSARNFRQLLENQWAQSNFVCVGLDSQPDKIPEFVRQGRGMKGVSVTPTIIAFNRAIVEATMGLVCAYKPNTAFYEAHGYAGIMALQQTIVDIHAMAPDVPVILDAKRGDIGNTNAGYVSFAFNFLQADAITVHPYLGAEALKPFLDCAEKGIFVLCRTSNPGAGEFQDSWVGGEPLWSVVARHVANDWDENRNCGLVVGATYPNELREIRRLAGDMPILIPGIGAQGGDVEQTVTAGMNKHGHGMIINSSRGIIFASSGADFAEVARRETEKLRDMINRYRE
jgi:orotidine-5'-phosphate decarboxylase